MNMLSFCSRLRFAGAALLLLGFAVLSVPPASWAGGLSCSIGEVVIENLKVGQSYSLVELVNLPLSITNTGDRRITLRVDPLVPGAGELRSGAEPIPNLTWVRAEPDGFDLGPQETKAVELFLAIPDDERLFGRKFQVHFWSHSLPQAGDMLAYGLSSRVIFTIDAVREVPGATVSGDLSLSLVPSEIRLEGVVPGRMYRLETVAGEPLAVRSTSSQEISVELRVLNSAESLSTLPTGYADLSSAAIVELSPARFTLGPGEEMRITGTVVFPKGKQTLERKFMGVVSAAVTNMSVETQIYTRIYASVR